MSRWDSLEDELDEEVLSGGLDSSPFAAQQRLLAAERMAASRPILSTRLASDLRRWPLGFILTGTGGQTLDVSVAPQVLFRPEKLIATDTGAPGGAPPAGAGLATVITGIFVGQKHQLPVAPVGTAAATTGISTSAFSANALENGMRWDTCQKGILITFRILFLFTSTWTGTLWGHTVK